MRASDDDERLLSSLAHEFAQRLREGEQPSLDEFIQRHPHLADAIRELFPTVALMESLQPASRFPQLPDPSANASPPHRRLGDYRVVREAGRGGMGVVYEAIQESLGRRVALKVLPSSVGAACQQLQRFRREACVGARLHHTNIVPVFDVGEAEGVYFYAMQFIDGLSLAEVLQELRQGTSAFGGPNLGELVRLQPAAPEPSAAGSNRRGRHPPEHPLSNLPSRNGLADHASGTLRTDHQHIAWLGRQAADALAYAHREGVIHRDIKPHNLLLDSDGTLWITDFGLAQIADQIDLTSPGDVIGTLRYLPPERFDGQADPRGDIYSLGATLYELLTRQPAFNLTERSRLVEQILTTGPARPRQLDPRIPRDLETIVLKTMARDPEQRYASAELLAEDLERFLEDRPIRARRLSAWGHAWRWCRRNRFLASATCVAAVLLVTTVVMSTVDSIQIRGLLHETQVARRHARERLFDSLVSQTHARWMGGPRDGRRFESLRLVREARALAGELKLAPEAIRRLRTEAIAALCIPDEEIVGLVPAFPVGTALLDFDPQLSRYARGDTEGNVVLCRVADGQLLGTLASSGPGYELHGDDGIVFSPDGKYLQHRCTHPRDGTSHLRLWDVSQDTPRLAFELQADIVGRTDFAADGHCLGILIRDKPEPGSPAQATVVRLHSVDPATGKTLTEPLEVPEAEAFRFHPREPRVAMASSQEVAILELSTGRPMSRWPLPKAAPLAWSPDGRQLLAGTPEDGRIHRWNVASQRELPPLETGDTERPSRIVFGPDGDRFAAQFQFEYRVWSYPAGRPLWHSRQGLAALRFGEGGHILAGSHGPYPQIRLLRLDHAFELERLELAEPVTNQLGLLAAQTSRDGKLLAATGRDGIVLLSLRTLEQLAVIPGRHLPIQFLPDDSLLSVGDPPEGLVRWPLHREDSDNQVVVGPPAPFGLKALPDAAPHLGGPACWSASRDGSVVAAPTQASGDQRAHVFLADNGNELANFRKLDLGVQHGVRYVSVHPQGRWVATGSSSWMANRNRAVDSVTVWEPSSGRRVVDLLVGEGFPHFSPDGQWIAVASSAFPEGVRLWRVGTWEPAPPPARISGPSCAQVAFDGRSQYLAVQGHQVRLLEPATGRELALLSVPEETSLAPQCFTPDGTRLIAWGIHTGQLYVWDLQSIRKQLAEMGLDWEPPPNESPEESSHSRL